MRSNPFRSCVGAFALGWILAVSQAAATMTYGTWGLDQSNTFADGVNYGTVHIEADASTGQVRFEVTAAILESYGTVNKFGIQKFGFNHEGVTSDPAQWLVSLPGHWSQDSGGGQMSGFGRFEVSEFTNGANHRTGALVFTITLPDASEAIASNFAVLSTGSAGEGQSLFAAHVAGFANGGSHFIAGSHLVDGSPGLTSIPEPATLSLLALSLAVVGVRRGRGA